MDVLSFVLGFVKGKSSNSFTDEELSEGLDYINGEQVYTVKYYDGDTLLKTEYKPYGAVLDFTPYQDTDQRVYYWEPKLATVTSDVDYHLMRENKLSFATASWADIARVSEGGRAARHFSVGDTKQVDMSDGLSTIVIPFAIAGFDHDALSAGGTAGMSIVAMGVSNRHTSTWSSTTTPCAYGSSLLYTKMLTMYSAYIPEELKAVIKSVTKEVDSNSALNSETSLSNLKLWPLSYTELGDTSVLGELNVLGKPYPLFPKNNVFFPGGVAAIPVVETGSNATYWLRQVKQTTTRDPLYVDGSGGCIVSTGTTINSTNRYIRFGFCV